jgi:hypothetical protein
MNSLDYLLLIFALICCLFMGFAMGTTLEKDRWVIAIKAGKVSTQIVTNIVVNVEN